MGIGSIRLGSTKRRTRIAIVGIAVSLAVIIGVVVASCGGGSTETTATTPTTAVAADGGAQVVLKGFAFDPETVTIKTGESVTWTNEDSANHTVVGDSGGFESGSLANGDAFSFEFDTPGTYAYHCSLHPSMKGTVIVE
jgi:plastocyanin